MKTRLLLALLPLTLAAAAIPALTGHTAEKTEDRYYVVEYPPSTRPGQLQFGVTYTLWVPKGVKTIRGVIVHQHGCGSGACKGGETAAYDLHWQALARKWDCALAGPSYHQEDTQNCRLWCDPRNGSDAAFMRSLDDFAQKTGHPELKTAPWCLWGHSGGGFWESLMQMKYPERIVAIWFRSGTGYDYWKKGEIPTPTIPDAAMRIPMVANPGIRERDDARFRTAYTGSMAMFEDYRSKGAPIAFALDPRSHHDTGDSRYLAIPFFDACLGMRLPDQPGQPLKPVDNRHAYLAPVLGTEAVPAAKFKGDLAKSSWLPNASVARAWEDYVKVGAVNDTTPPPAPDDVRAVRSGATVELTWHAEADLDSGIQSFVILRDGAPVGRVPEKPVGRYGRPLFQTMSYHDTPEKPLPAMRFVDMSPGGAGARYSVVMINSAGLKSEPSKSVPVR